MPTLKDSWRADVYEIFRDYSIEGVPLLSVYENLVGYSDKRGSQGGVTLPRCPAIESCTARDLEVPWQGTVCPICASPVFPTDTLRVHEEVLEEHQNLTALGRLMTSLEQLSMVGYLQFLLRRQPRVLGVVGFILDGPLALFGPQAWLHTPISSFVNDVYQVLRDQRLGLPLIVGIEKTGQFAEHASAIADRIPVRHLMMLPDTYIYRHIVTSRPVAGSTFGRDTYYGQKFFYKTATGQILTMTVPKPMDHLADPHRPDHYPMLSATIALLDKIGTAVYEDAVIPVALAHSFAAIPLRTGSRVLALLSRQLLGQAEG
jgi:hypothetical protein